jgi:diguanylate cyclase (GGDEF)-like protein/PAS domain S-box-containing protein
MRKLARNAEPIAADSVGDYVYDKFMASPEMLTIPVVDENHKPVGLVDRNTFFTQYAAEFGRALYGKRPIMGAMDCHLLSVEADTLVGEFARLMLEESRMQLTKGFVVTDAGYYFGIGAVIDLLKASVEEREQAAQTIMDMAQTLRESNTKLERERRLSEAVIEHIPSLITVRTGLDGEFIIVNKSAEILLGAERSELVGRSISEIGDRRLRNQLRTADDELRRTSPGIPMDLEFVKRGDCSPLVYRTVNIAVEMPDSEPLMLTVADDVTEAKHAINRIEQLAHFDVLTGLLNRALFQERLDQALGLTARARTIGSQLQTGLLVIDVDRFKSVNDTYGHGAGDMLLREAARRLRSVLRNDDVAARLGGDEFGILMIGEDLYRSARLTAKQVTELMARPFQIADQTVHLGASVGVALFPDDAVLGEDLVKHADIALYRAKAEGRGTWRRFDATMLADLQRRRNIERGLREALERSEFEAHFQPVFNLERREVSGFEALMRWNHSEFGKISPSKFIPIAEDIGLIGALGEWMIREACAVASRLPPDTTMAVNISAFQFRQAGFVPSVVQALAHSGIAPQNLEIEVTESVLLEEEAIVMKSMRQLRDIGVKIVLDDFGTGYASLAYLQRFPFDKIKIDKSFVKNLPYSQSSVAIISAVIALAGKLGIVTTAEGIETQEQFDAVASLGCQEVQGFIIGKPTHDPFSALNSSWRQEVA